MGHTKWHRARGGALPVGSFQGRSLGWRLERWETGWPATLRSCGTAELVPVMTDSYALLTPTLAQQTWARCLDPQQWMPHRQSVACENLSGDVTVNLASQGMCKQRVAGPTWSPQQGLLLTLGLSLCRADGVGHSTLWMHLHTLTHLHIQTVIHTLLKAQHMNTHTIGTRPHNTTHKQAPTHEYTHPTHEHTHPPMNTHPPTHEYTHLPTHECTDPSTHAYTH